LGVLGALLGTWAFAAFRTRLRRWGFETTGSNLRSRFLALENSNLVTQLLDGFLQSLYAILQVPDDGKETLDERRPFLGWYRGKLHPHASQYRKHFLEQLRPHPGLLRSYSTMP
jgi:hypothetical protein